MKTNNIFLLAAAALLFVNCAREEIDVTFKTGTAVAVMETEDTKSNVTDQGYFTWTTGDKIAIHTNNAILEGTLSDGENTPDGTFTYSYVDGQEPTGYAMYPYSEQHSISESVTFHMPAEYELGETMNNTNAPMLAVPAARSGEGKVNYNFSHLGGVIRVVFKNAPVGTDKFTLSLGESKINGDFTVADGKISTAEAGEGENLTTLNFSALTSVQDITLFVPVPTGDYTGIEAKLYKEEELLGTWGSESATNNIERRALVLMAPITFSNAGGNIENNQQVSSSGELAAAVANGGTVTVTEGITLEQEVVVPAGKEVVLDLNGNTINAKQIITVAEGAKLSIVNNATAPMVKSGDAVSGAKITSSTDIIKASKDAVITIGEGVELITNGGGSSVVWIPRYAENVTLNSAGILKATAAGAGVISHNGYLTSGTINILGGSISHKEDVAVYVAGNADVTVSEGVEITGTTAMEVRAGKLTVNGGKFVATANPSEYVPNGNGTTSKGVALAMCKHSTTENQLVVEINGGEFTGAKSLLVNTDLGPVSLTVNGGTFSDLLPLEYAKSGATINLGASIISSDRITINNDVTIDGNNHKIDYTGTDRAFQIIGGTVNIKNVTINMLDSTPEGSRGVNLYNGDTNAAIDVTLDNVTINGYKAYAVNIGGGNSNKLTIKNSNITGYAAINVAKESKNHAVEVVQSVLNGKNHNKDWDFGVVVVDGINEHSLKIDSATKINTECLSGVNSRYDKVVVGVGCKYDVANDIDVAVRNVICDGIYNIGLKGITDEDGTIQLLDDIEITEAVIIPEGIKITFDLNGHTIENKTAGHPSNITPNVDDQCVVFMVSGNLTITGEGEVKATGDGVKSNFNTAVWAMGSNAKVTINGGSYSNALDTDGDGCDLIYARDGAQIEINGGSFVSSVRKTLGDGVFAVLNCKDNTNSKITVNGGTFHNYVPSFENVGSGEIVLGAGRNVYNDEELVNTAHTGETDVWYTVK